jgi:hypothetical protein
MPANRTVVALLLAFLSVGCSGCSLSNSDDRRPLDRVVVYCSVEEKIPLRIAAYVEALQKVAQAIRQRF